MSLADLQATAHVQWSAKLAEPRPQDAEQACPFHLFEFSRHPQVLRAALLEGEQLKECRDLLSKHGLAPELPCGAKVFVRPEHFGAVLAALEGHDLKPWHVVAEEVFQEAVMASVRGLPSREQVREKSRSSLKVPPSCSGCRAAGAGLRCGHCRKAFYCSRKCQATHYSQHRAACTSGSDTPATPFWSAFDTPIVVKHTYIHVVVPSSLRSEPDSQKTASTSDANPRVMGNPRKA